MLVKGGAIIRFYIIAVGWLGAGNIIIAKGRIGAGAVLGNQLDLIESDGQSAKTDGRCR